MTPGAARWEQAAEAYATGEHKSGRELELAVEFAAPTGSERVLDIGAGAGHTALALAPHVKSVVVTDPIEAMLVAARTVFAQAGVHNAEFQTAKAEALPFDDASFDIVTSRLAAHHFDDVPLAMREVARVLRPSGIFVFIDTLAPEDAESAAYQDEVERQRDPTHRRVYTQGEWIAFASRRDSVSSAPRSSARPTTSNPGWHGVARIRRPSRRSAGASSTLRPPPSGISISSWWTAG